MWDYRLHGRRRPVTVGGSVTQKHEAKGTEAPLSTPASFACKQLSDIIFQLSDKQ